MAVYLKNVLSLTAYTLSSEAASEMLLILLYVLWCLWYNNWIVVWLTLQSIMIAVLIAVVMYFARNCIIIEVIDAVMMIA